MSSNALIETGSQMPQEPARNLPFQVCQSPLVTGRSPMQSSLSVPQRDLHRQESQGPSRKTSIQMQPGRVMDPGLPILRSLLVHPSHQVPPRSSVRSGFQGSLRPKVLSGNYGDQQKHRETQTTYSKEQKRLLQDHFDECNYPNQEQRRALALLIGVTAYEIQIWFKNKQAKSKRENLQNVPAALPEMEALKLFPSQPIFLVPYLLLPLPMESPCVQAHLFWIPFQNSTATRTLLCIVIRPV